MSPFVLFFLFALLSAAYRWGFRETLTTAVVIVLIFLLQTAAVTAAHWPSAWLADGTFELNAIITRVAYLLLTGFLLGYLADQDKQLRPRWRRSPTRCASRGSSSASAAAPRGSRGCSTACSAPRVSTS